MIAYSQPRYISTSEYLNGERQAETKNEYLDGVIVAMTGASWEHHVITSNLQGELYHQLKGTPCVPASKDLQVRSLEYSCYEYPDLAAVCDKPNSEDHEFDTVLNPTLIVEVLFSSMEAKGRGEKLISYVDLKLRPKIALLHLSV